MAEDSADRLQIALAQIKPSLGNLTANLKVHEDYFERAAAEGAELVVFPELSLTGYYLQDLVPDVSIDTERSDLFDKFRRMSDQADLVVGFVERGSDFRFFNSAAYLSKGQIVHIHRKLYLPTYGMFDEYRYFSPGDTLRSFETRFGTMGMLICEDMWHPSTFFLLANDGAQLILGPSAGPGRGVYRGATFGSVQAWQAIIHSASQSYMIYVTHCNRVGVEDGVSFGGGSEVSDPFGTCLVKGKTLDEDLIFAEIDKAEIQRARTLYPLMRDERLDLNMRELERIYKKRFQL